MDNEIHELKLDESFESFEKSFSFGNNEAVYEYAKPLVFCNDEEGGLQYIQKAADNNCIRAMYQYAYYL